MLRGVLQAWQCLSVHTKFSTIGWTASPGERNGHSCNGMLIRNSYVMYQKVTLPVTLNDVWRSLQLQKPLEYQYFGYLLSPDLRREGALSVDGHRLSVCLSVSTPRPKSRTERSLKPIFGTMEAHDPGDSWTRFKVKGQGHRADYSWHTKCAISSECEGLRTSNLVDGRSLDLRKSPY